MANFVSPGSYTIEKDVSDYAPSVNPSIVGLVGFASKGPTDTATLVTSPADLIRTFGTPDLVNGGQGIYGALDILQKTNQVYYVRSATSQAKEANYGIPLAIAPHSVIMLGSMSANLAYRFDCRTFDKAGEEYGELTSFYAYRERPYVSAGDGGSLMPTTPSGEWTNVDWNNAFIAGVGDAFDADTGQVAYIPSGLGAGSGLIVGRKAGAGNNGQGSRLECQVYISSSMVGDNASWEGTYLSSTPIDVNDLTWQKAIDIAGYQTNAELTWNIIRACSGAVEIDGPGGYQNASSTTVAGDYPGKIGAASGMTLKTGDSAGAYSIQSLYPGLGYNYSAINYQGGIQFRGLEATVTNTNRDGQFALNILNDGGVEESYNMVIAKPSNTTSATSNYPEDVLNKGLANAISNYVKGNFYTYDSGTVTSVPGTDGTGTVSGVPAWTNSLPTAYGTGVITGSHINGIRGGLVTGGAGNISLRCVTLQEGRYSFSQGKNGDASDYNGNMSNADVKSALIGTTGAKTGMYALDQEDVPVTMAAVPGVTEQSVQNALITMAERTQNFLAVVSPPVGFQNAQQAVNWSNGKATGRTASINSSYAAVYWPWLKSFDAYTGTDRFYDPSIYALGQMCYTDEVADPWFAPAGLSRGRLTKPVDVEVKLNQGDRDALYGPGNIVNPITKFTNDGIVIYGQKTGQRAATALDRINVRRLMIYLRRLVLTSSRRFVFEPNDPITWGAIRGVLNPALADIQQRRGLVSFKVVCDGTTNTPLRVDRNELWCKVILKPTKTAEILVFELNLTNQSASV